MKPSAPTPILLFSVNDYLSLYVARVLDRDKYTLYFLGPMGQAVRFSRFCKKYFTCANTDITLVNQINTISRKYSITSVIALDLSTSVCLSRIKTQLDCPVFPVSNASDIMRIANKWEIIPLLDALNLPHPKTVLINTPDELTHAILPKPFLIKPLMQGGGRGIKKINAPSDVVLYHQTFSPYKTFPLIIQEYIDGSDVDLSLIAMNGVIQGWTIQRRNKQGDIEFIEDPDVLSIGKKLIGHLRYSGFMHIDMIREAKTGLLFLLECNPRVWGSIGASIGAGVDFIWIALQCS